MVPPINKRMPLSCEPCRERKIRCPRRTTYGKGPCETCVRRGIPPSECVYLRDMYGRRGPPGGAGSAGVSQSDNADLVERLDRLERLLQARAGSSMQADVDADVDAFNTSQLPSPESVQREEPLNAHSTTPSPDLDSSHSTQAPVSTPIDSPHGALLTLDSGHERYTPSAAKSSSALRSNPMTHQLDTAIDSYATNDDVPFTTSTKTVADMLAFLPPRPQCDRLKGIYFDVFAPLFHILHDPTFHAAYADFQTDPHQGSLSWLALLFAILSVSVIAVSDDILLQDLGRRKTKAENMSLLCLRYRTAAMKCLEADHYLWRHNMYTLKTLIILIYGINQTHGQSWALLGTARNIALSLGCHVDPDAFNLDIIAAEGRRRCWAGLAMLYTVQNTTLGHLDSNPLPACNVQLPLDVDDDQLVVSAPRNSGLSGGPSQMSYLLLKFRLYDLCSRICDAVFVQDGVPNTESIRMLDAEILSQQQSLNCKYFLDTTSRPLPDYHSVHLNILFGYAHQLTLLLHRPIVTRWAVSGGRMEDANEHVLLSRDRCIESSRALIGIHKMLHDEPFYRSYMWYTRGLASFHAFHGVVCLVYILGACADIEPAAVDLLRQDLDSALAVFEEIEQSGLSPFCKKATPIVRKLLSVRIRATIEARNSLLLSTPSTLPPQYRESSQAHTLDGNDSRQCPDLVVDIEELMGGSATQPWLSPSSVDWTAWSIMLQDGGAAVDV